jgi:two-component system sensor histidine kinase KdpD
MLPGMRELRGISAALAGVILITAAIGLVRPWLDIPSLAVAYVLLVLWVGAVWGRLQAIGIAIIAFLTYDFFFVPPYGTLLISAPKDVLDLLVLLSAAVIGGALAASLREARRNAQASALTAQSLYEVAVSALKAPDLGRSLTAVVDSAARIPGIASMTLLDERGAEILAGRELPARERERGRWALRKGQPLGIRVHDGQVDLVRTAGPASPYAFLPLAAGCVCLQVSNHHLASGDRRLLAALLALAGLLLDRRKAELEAERIRELEVSDGLKAAVLSSISHELKSPLASLRAGLSTLSLPGAGLKGDELAIVEGLDTQADRLNRLVGDMLAMSRLEAGMPLEKQPVSLAEVLGTALRDLEPMLAGFQVVLEVDEDLPPVHADESQLQLVVGNLLANAAEWTEPGGRIDAGARAGDGLVSFWVQNEGDRIRPVDLDRVFDRFWTRRKRGSGLGLAICKRIVEAHGGTIRAENRRAGPRFTFALPVSERVTAA